MIRKTDFFLFLWFWKFGRGPLFIKRGERTSYLHFDLSFLGDPEGKVYDRFMGIVRRAKGVHERADWWKKLKTISGEIQEQRAQKNAP